MRAASAAAVTALAVLAAGCGGDGGDGRVIDGTVVASVAERHLKAEHSNLADGTMSCSDLALRKGAKTRCSRVASMKDGRFVRINGTVEVVDPSGDGKLHVSMDKKAVEYGVRGDHLATIAGARVKKLLGIEPTEVICGDLVGQEGRAVVCTVTAGGRQGTVRFSVTEVDRAAYAVDYEVQVDGFTAS